MRIYLGFQRHQFISGLFAVTDQHAPVLPQQVDRSCNCQITWNDEYKFPYFEPGNIKGSRDQFDADVLAIKTIDAATLAAECKSGAEIKEKLYNARLEAMS